MSHKKSITKSAVCSSTVQGPYLNLKLFDTGAVGSNEKFSAVGFVADLT
jgi:hypothetical protein